MTTTYLVPGMTCDHCKVAVTEEVTKVAGVAAVERRPRHQARPHRRRRRPRGAGRRHRRGRLRRGGRREPAREARRLRRRAGAGVRRRRVRGQPARRPSRARRRPTSPPTWAGWPRRRCRCAASRSATTASRSSSRARTAQPGRRFELAFRIADRRGQTVRDFDVEHTKRMHFIVVRRDMTGFQHLHPTQRPDGSWSVPVTLPDAGSYRVFADFSVGDKPHTLADDLTVDGSVRSHALPGAGRRAPTSTASRVTLTSRAAGARLHRHARRQPGRHPGLPGRQGPPRRAARGRSRLPARAPRRGPPRGSRPTFPTAGRYRLFLQFKTATAGSTPPRSRAR